MSDDQRSQQDQLGRRLRILSLDQSFTVERRLAESASGRTELVRDDDGSQFVRKYLAADLVPDNPYRFLLNLDSASFPKVVLLYELADAHVVVMEYLHGQSLADRVSQQGRLTVGQVLDLGDQLLQAVEVIHALTPPLIHRDIKPSNLLLTPGPTAGSTTVKLIDFGASRLYKADQVKDTEAFGTRGFAAPEQFGFRQTDERTDLYAVGVSLYYALTGQVLDSAARQWLAGVSRSAVGLRRSDPPGWSGGLGAGPGQLDSAGWPGPVGRSAAAGQPGWPERSGSSGRPGLAPGRPGRADLAGLTGTCLALARIILRATEFDPDQRFGSAGQFRQELAAACSVGGPVGPQSTGQAAKVAADYFPLPSQNWPVTAPTLSQASQASQPSRSSAAASLPRPSSRPSVAAHSSPAASAFPAQGVSTMAQAAAGRPTGPGSSKRPDPRRFIWKLPLGLGLGLLALGAFAAPLQHPDQLARFGLVDFLLQLVEFWPLTVWCLLASLLLLNPFGLRNRLAWFRVKTRRRVWSVLAAGFALWLLVGLTAYSLLPTAMQAGTSSDPTAASSLAAAPVAGVGPISIPVLASIPDPTAGAVPIAGTVASATVPVSGPAVGTVPTLTPVPATSAPWPLAAGHKLSQTAVPVWSPA